MTECFAHSRNQTPPGVALEVLHLSMVSIKNSYCATIPWLPPKLTFLRCSMVAATAVVGEYSRTPEFTFACLLACFISGILENRVFGLPWPQKKLCYVVSYHSRHYRLSCRCALSWRRELANRRFCYASLFVRCMETDRISSGELKIDYCKFLTRFISLIGAHH